MQKSRYGAVTYLIWVSGESEGTEENGAVNDKMLGGEAKDGARGENMQGLRPSQ